MMTDLIDQTVIVQLQRIVTAYKRENENSKKFILLWELGNILKENSITSQKHFWWIQNKGYYINRSILLRAYWLRTAFNLDEVKKINLSISKIFPYLSYLAPNSLKLDNAKKQLLKKSLLQNELPKLFLNKRKLKSNKIQSIEIKTKLKEMIICLSKDEMLLFKKIVPANDFEKLKVSIFSMLRYDLPSSENIQILKDSKNICELNKLTNLAEVFGILCEAAENTKTDSKVMLKSIFDPDVLNPFLDGIFFSK